MIRTFTNLSDLPQAAQILNSERGWLSVIVPIARTNLITNPSFETATTNYTAVGGSIARSTTQSYHGAYSLAVTPTAATTDGVFYGTVSLTSGTTYAASCKIYAAPGVKYKISFATTGGVDLAAYRFVGTGRWQWVWVYYTETSSTTRRIYITKDTQTSTAVFYVDGVQVEALATGETVSTYIDGDQQSLLSAGQFPPAYGWNGARHASTSYRTAQTRDGGHVKNLDLFKLYLTALVGLGLADPTHIANEQGYSDGAAYQTSIVPSREFSVRGRFNTRSDIELDQARTALGSALALDATAPRQPVAFVYQKYDGTEPTSDTGKIVASYKTGMGYRQDNRIGEDVEIPFQMWFPFVATNDQGAAITTSESIAISSATALMFRDHTGDWSVLDSQATAFVRGAAYNPVDGMYYVVGDFTTIGGTSANRIAKFDPVAGTFSALGTGLAGGASPRGLVVRVAPNGDVFVGGAFTTANGVTVNNVTYWNGTTFVAMGSGGTKGVDSTVQDIALDSLSNAWVTGDFANAGGAGASFVAKWTKSTDAWSALGTGLNGGGQSIVVSLGDTFVYVSGTSFSTANGVSVTNIAAWNGTTFVALGSGLSPVGAFQMQIGPDGALYAAGGFATAGGNAAENVARWNGFVWSALGGGVSNDADQLVFAADGLMYVAGNAWTTVNGITVSDSFAAWNGSAWVLPDLEMPGTANFGALAAGPRGELLLGLTGSSGTATAAQLNTLTNSGSTRAYPTFYITGPSSSTSRLYQIRSYTTGAIVSFNLTINTGETITIQTSPFGITVRSTVRGDITTTIVPGSAPEFFSLPGANSVAVLITGSAVTMTATWPKCHVAIEELTY